MLGKHLNLIIAGFVSLIGDQFMFRELSVFFVPTSTIFLPSWSVDQIKLCSQLKGQSHEKLGEIKP
jgi:hypothetical protein